MPSDSLIRLRQLNKPEVSGYAVEIIKQYLSTGTGVSVVGTGSLTGVFYPLKSNPSGYITGSRSEFVLTSQTGDFVDEIALALSNANLLVQIASTYYPSANPSGFISRTSGDALYVQFAPAVNTGRITLDDNTTFGYAFDYNPNKWFHIRGTGDSEIQFYNTGNASGAVINGFSIYSNNIRVSGKSVLNDHTRFINVNDDAPNTRLFLKDAVKAINPFQYQENNSFVIRGVEDAIIDLYDSGRSYNQPYISGFDIYAKNLYINGQVFTGGAGSSGGGSGDVTFAQLTGASGALRTDIETIRVGTGRLVPTGLTGKLLVAKSETGNFFYYAMTGDAYFNGGPLTYNSRTAIPRTMFYINPGTSYFLSSESKLRIIDFSGNAQGNDLGSPLITGFTVDAPAMTITGSRVVDKWYGDSLYYPLSNPSDYASKAYVASLYALDVNVAKINNTTHNTSFYLRDSTASSNPLSYVSSSRQFKILAPSGLSAIDVYGTPNILSGKPYISGFYISGVPRIDAKEIYINGTSIGNVGDTGTLISMIDRKHNTGFGLWNTGANAYAFEYNSTNGSFYLQGYTRHPNGAVDAGGTIDVQNSRITNFDIKNPINFEQYQGEFKLYDAGSAVSLLHFNANTLNFWLGNSESNAYIDVNGAEIASRPTITGFDVFAKSLTLSGSTVATQSYVTGVSGVIVNRLDSTGAALYALIQASNAGVSSLNGASGSMTITGAGGVNVTRLGQTITVSGDTSLYLTTGNTGAFVNINDGRNLKLGGLIELSNRLHTHVIESEITSGQAIKYQNIAHRTHAAGTLTGTYVLNTPIPRASNIQGFVRVYGHGFSNHIGGPPAQTSIIDFTVGFYAYSVITGNIDGVSGAVSYYGIIDNSSNRNLSKWVGINQSGNVAIGFGESDSTTYFYAVAAEATLFRSSALTTGVYHTGWFFSNETGTDFGWLDKKQVSGTLYHNHLVEDIHGTGVFYPRTGNPLNFLTPSDTGVLDNTFISHAESGSFYPRFQNPSGYINSGNLAGYVQTSQTGAYDNTFVSHNESGILTGTFVKRIETGSYFNTFLEKTETGAFVGVSQTGAFYPKTGGQVQGSVAAESLVANKYGFDGGIYTFRKVIGPSSSANVFSITNTIGTHLVDVFINQQTGSYVVAKKYTAAMTWSGTPRVNMTMNTGPYSVAGRDFTANFSRTGADGLLMTINNTATLSGNFLVTMVLASSWYKNTIVEY